MFTENFDRELIHLLLLFCHPVENGHAAESEVSSIGIRLHPGGPQLNDTGICPLFDLLQASTLKESSKQTEETMRHESDQ